MPTASQDIVATVIDPKAHADPSRLHESFAWLRKNDPIALAELPGYDPFYVVTKHADILQISKDNALFPYGDHPSTLTDKAMLEERRSMGQTRPLLYTLVQMDEPDHMKYRALTQGWFMPPNLKKLEARVRECARESVERMIALGGECDFVTEVALHYPLRVIMEILGVSARGRAAHASADPGAVRRDRSGPATEFRRLARGQKGRDRRGAG